MLLTLEQARKAVNLTTTLKKLGDGWSELSSWVTGIPGQSISKVQSFSDTAGIIFNGKEHLVVFPGTDSPEDIIIDLHFVQETTPYGRMHTGFYDAWRGYESGLSRYLEANDPDKSIPITVAGHSLGATMALLAANYLARQGYIVKETMVFGSPRVGDKTWVQSCSEAGVKVVRVVNDQDIITRVPWFWGYEHVGEAFYLDKKGNGRETRPFSPWFWLIGAWSWVLPFSITDHKITEYQKKTSHYLDGLPQ